MMVHLSGALGSGRSDGTLDHVPLLSIATVRGAMRRPRRIAASIDQSERRPIVRHIPLNCRPHLHATGARHEMDFGVQFFPAVDHTDKSAADYYAESLAIAEEADR